MIDPTDIRQHILAGVASFIFFGIVVLILWGIWDAIVMWANVLQ